MSDSLQFHVLNVAHQALLSMEFFRQEHWSGWPCPPPEDLPNLGIEPKSLALQVDSLPSESLVGLLFFYVTQELFRNIKYCQDILLFLISSLIPV